MTELEIAEFIVPITKVVGGDLDKYVIEIFKSGQIGLLEKERATQYRLKQDHAIIAEIPKLSHNPNTAIAQIALAVGRRLERFERGARQIRQELPTHAEKSHRTQSRHVGTQNRDIIKAYLAQAKSDKGMSLKSHRNRWLFVATPIRQTMKVCSTN